MNSYINPRLPSETPDLFRSLFAAAEEGVKKSRDRQHRDAAACREDFEEERQRCTELDDEVPF